MSRDIVWVSRLEEKMEQPWYVRLLWWLCEKADHPLIDGGWIFNGHYHRQCRICRRIVSEPIKP